MKIRRLLPALPLALAALLLSPARLCFGEAQTAAAPVSYTHLDVYKRQVLADVSYSAT